MEETHVTHREAQGAFWCLLMVQNLEWALKWTPHHDCGVHKIQSWSNHVMKPIPGGLKIKRVADCILIIDYRDETHITHYLGFQLVRADELGYSCSSYSSFWRGFFLHLIWILVTSLNGIICLYDGWGLNRFLAYRYKVEGLMMEKPSRIVDYIRPGPYRLQWDRLMTTMDIVQTLDKVKHVFKIKPLQLLKKMFTFVSSSLYLSQDIQQTMKAKMTEIKLYNQ